MRSILLLRGKLCDINILRPSGKINAKLESVTKLNVVNDVSY